MDETTQRLLNGILSGARTLPSEDREWFRLSVKVNGLEYRVKAKQVAAEGQSPRWDDNWTVADYSIVEA